MPTARIIVAKGQYHAIEIEGVTKRFMLGNVLRPNYDARKILEIVATNVIDLFSEGLIPPMRLDFQPFTVHNTPVPPFTIHETGDISFDGSVFLTDEEKEIHRQHNADRSLAIVSYTMLSGISAFIVQSRSSMSDIATTMPSDTFADFASDFAGFWPVEELGQMYHYLRVIRN